MSRRSVIAKIKRRVIDTGRIFDVLVQGANRSLTIVFAIPTEDMEVSDETVHLYDCYFYLLYKRKGDATTQIPILMDYDKTTDYDAETGIITPSFQPTSYFTEKEGGLDIQLIACSTEQDFTSGDVDIDDIALWSTTNAQISIAKSQLKDSQTIVAEDMFTKGIAEMSAYLESSDADALVAEGYAKGTQNGTPVGSTSPYYEKNAKWYKEQAGVYYAYVQSLETDIVALYNDKANLDAIADDLTNIDTVATNIGDVNDVADDIAKIKSVADDLTKIDNVADDLTKIDAVQAKLTEITTVANDIANVNTVANDKANIDLVAGDKTNIDAVAGNKTNIDKVAAIDSDVSKVADIDQDVTAVALIDDEVSDVAGIKDDVSAVADIKDDVSAVADIDDDISTLVTNISDINDVADDLTKIDSVADDLTNIDAVADDLTNIDAVAAEIPNLGLKENVSNKVTSISSSSTDTQYPSAKAVYTADTNLKNAIDSNTARIENLEQEHGSLVPVQYRGTNAVPTGKAKYAMVEKIVGKSRGWNQLVSLSAVATSNMSGASVNASTQTASGTVVNADGSFYLNMQNASNFNTVSGHKYLFVIPISAPSALTGIKAYISNSIVTDVGIEATLTISNGMAIGIATASATKSVACLCIYSNGTSSAVAGQTVTITKPFIRDVTLILNDWADADITTANIPLMVKQIPDILTYDSYGYGIKDTIVGGVESRFVNMFDYTDIQAFQACSLSNGVIKNTNADALSYFAPQFQFFNGGTYVGSSAMSSTGYTGTYNGTFTTPNAPFTIVRFKHNGGSVDIFVNYNNSDIGLEQGKTYSMNMYILGANPSVVGGLSWKDMQICSNDLDASIKNVYHAYHAPSTLSLPSPVTLRSAGDVAEVYDLESGDISHPIGTQDLSQLSWTYEAGDDYWWWKASFSKGQSVPSSGATIRNCVHAMYMASNQSRIGSYDNEISYSASTIYVRTGNQSVEPTGTMYFALSTPDTPTNIGAIANCMIATEGGGTINTIQTQTPVIDNCLDVAYLAL